MSIPTFAAQKKAWSSPPVDDIGYIPAKDLLAMSDDDFVATMTAAIENRYSGWRNYRNRWWDHLLPETDENKRVLDYGCGIGIEALQYTGRGNEVWVADIVPDNLKVARRLFKLSGEQMEGSPLVLTAKPPFLSKSDDLAAREYFDIIHCAGVLHHIPNAQEVVKQMHSWLVPKGELRLMLYSDVAWTVATGVPPPRDTPTHEHPMFETYVRHWDAVGGYADWYDAPKLQAWFGEWFNIAQYQPLTQGGAYVAARLVKRR